MRTTLDVADDVLQAAKELARREKKTAGEMISHLARQGLQGASTGGTREKRGEEFLGFRPFPSRGGLVTKELIDKLRAEEAG
ncbi:MAG: antitoxin [Deltaproteobacteria bacterium]|nr:antitoxin [Deltaproteobacteria bacterium]